MGRAFARHRLERHVRAGACLAVLALADACALRRLFVEPPRLRDLPQDAEVQTYDVRGRTAAELRAQLDALGPKDWKDVRHDARTQWEVTWTLSLDERPGTCAVADARAKARITFTFPRWVDAEDAPAPLRSRWQRYLDALVLHENGHRRNALHAESELAAVLRRVPPAATCAEVAAAADAKGNEIVARHRRRDLVYDTNTQSGAQQGATFP